MSLVASELAGAGSVPTGAGDDSPGGGGGGGAGVTSFNGATGAIVYKPKVRVANVTALAALPSAAANGHDLGDIAFVDTVSDYFQLVTSALTVDNITVVNATGRAGAQWVRLLIAAPANALKAFWAVDPTSGNDEAVGSGTTQAAANLVALKTMQEVKRRLWGLETKQSTVVQLIRSMPSTDVGTWNTRFKFGTTFTVAGPLGAVTGPSGVVDNTVHSGTLTSAPTVPADVPTADDYEITDTALPVSWTASGMLAPGILFKRTNGAARYWWPLKDLGTKKIRTTAPMSNLTALTSYGGGAMANGDAYSAYQLVSFYNQDWGVQAGQVVLQDLYDISTAPANLQSLVGYGTQRLRTDVGGTALLNIATQWTNPLLRLAGANRIATNTLGQGTGSIVGGGGIGTGASTISVFSSVILVAGCWIGQGICWKTNDAGVVQMEREWQQHDCTGPCLESTTPGGMISIMIASVGQGMSGKGNTSKLVSANLGGAVYYGFSGAKPPFIAGLTTDANPIQIGAASYTVANLPATADTLLTPSVTKNTLP